MLLPERLGAPEPVNRRGGPDRAEKEGAHEDDRQHNNLRDSIVCSRMEVGFKREIKEVPIGEAQGPRLERVPAPRDAVGVEVTHERGLVVHRREVERPVIGTAGGATANRV